MCWNLSFNVNFRLSKLERQREQLGLDSDLEKAKEGTYKRAGNRHQSEEPEIKDGLHKRGRFVRI